MTDTASRQQTLFVLLPSINVWNRDEPSESLSFLRLAGRQVAPRRGTRGAPTALQAAGAVLHILDRVAPADTVLVSLSGAQRLALQREHPGLRIVPVIELAPLWYRRTRVLPVLGPANQKKRNVEVLVLDAATDQPMAGVDVVGFIDREQRVGAAGVTNAKGIARLSLPFGLPTLEVIEAVPPAGHWPGFIKRVKLDDGTPTLRCHPIDLAEPGAMAHYGLHGGDGDGAGVKVGVVDTGVSRHPDLRLKRARNVVRGEPANDADDEVGHGTHVAGIIAGRGKPGQGMRGVAPAAELHAYRVFGKGEGTATSFNVAKAIRQAVDDGCDLINLSLGGAEEVPEVWREIQRARAMGVVCVAATGNDYRAPVGYPGRYSQVLAVSACGRRGTFPASAGQTLTIAKPHGTDPKDFIADFSNVGCEVKLTGPGVGIVSTVPGGYAVMDGTSMACPAMTGSLARLLARDGKLLGAARNQHRSDAIFKLALDAARPLGFGEDFEGAGLLV